MTRSSRYDKDEREFLFQSLTIDFFSAFDNALQTRRTEDGFDRKILGERIDKDKTGVSKLVAKPANWTTRTMSDYANALDVDVVLYLLDRKIPGRRFCREGVMRENNKELMKHHYDSMIESNTQLLDNMRSFEQRRWDLIGQTDNTSHQARSMIGSHGNNLF